MTRDHPCEPVNAEAPPATPSSDAPRMLPRFIRAVVHRGPLGVFAVCLLVTFLNFAVWSVATPLFASSDEPTQVAYAAAAVRGDVVGTTIGSDRVATTRISVPEVFAAGGRYAACDAFDDHVTAACSAPLPASSRTVRTTTYAGRYPPLYYLVVGIPSLVAVSASGIYLMRLVSALLNAVLISLALTSVIVWSRRRLLVVGVLVAATPMAWFMGSVVNPSGFEVCAAICVWSSGLVLVLDRASRPPGGLVAVVAGSLCALLVARPLSPLWGAIIVVVLGIVGGRRHVVALAESRAVRWAAGPVAVCGGFAVAWILAVHSLDLKPVGVPVPSSVGGAQLLGSIFGRTGTWARQMVGVFGWLDTASPLLTYVIWACVVGVVFLLGVAAARARQAAGLVVLVLAAVLVPVAVVFSQAHRLGIDWQGRYTLPLAVGVPILAVGFVERGRVLGRWRPVLGIGTCVAVLVADVGSFLEAMRRYTVGVTGPVDFLDGRWHPPLGTLPVALAGCLALAALAGLVAVVSVAPERPPLPRVRPAPA